MENTPLSELPDYWQQHIRHLRSERADLRQGAVSVSNLDAEAQRVIRRLRHENGKIRIQRNEARAELAALRATLAAD